MTTINCQPHPIFEKWALELNDIDGGNPEADIWFCGIEPGGELPESLECNPSRCNNSGLPYWNKDFRDQLRNKNLNKWYFERRVVKLLIALGKINIPKEKINCYILEKLYEKDGICFKLNLYPLNCRRLREWTSKHRELSGFPNKGDYQHWCKKNRYPKLAKLWQEYEQPILICAGKMFWEEFIYAFNGEQANQTLNRSLNTLSLPNSRIILTRHFINLFSKDQYDIRKIYNELKRKKTK